MSNVIETTDAQRTAPLTHVNGNNGNGTDYNVDILMESKGVIENWGWAVEVKIPFKSLRYTVYALEKNTLKKC